MATDLKAGARVRDPALLRQLHFEFEECCICGDVEFSIHHVLKRSQGGDDVRENLVPLCGDGTSGCHGGVEANSDAVCRALGQALRRDRPEILRYLAGKLGSSSAAEVWLQRHLRLSF